MTNYSTVSLSSGKLHLFDGATTTKTILQSGDITDGDVTITLPAIGTGTYHLPVLEESSTTSITATPAELSILDGGTAATSTTIVSADRLVLNDNGTMVQVAVTDLDTYLSATTKTLTNKTLTSPTITGTGGIAGTFTGDITGDLTGNADTSTKIASITNSNIVQLIESQTLTNKTLTSPIINGALTGSALVLESAGIGANDNDTSIPTSAAVKDYVDNSGSSTTLNGLTDVIQDISEFTNSLLIQPNSDGSLPTTGTLSSALDNIGIGVGVFTELTSGDNNVCIGKGSGGAVIYSNTLFSTGHSTTEAKLDSGASNVLDYYKGMYLHTGSASYLITGYNQSTKVVEFDSGVTPSASKFFSIELFSNSVGAVVRSSNLAATGHSTTAAKLDSSALSVVDYYNGMYLHTGNNIYEIIDYTASTQTVTFSAGVAPSSNASYTILYYSSGGGSGSSATLVSGSNNTFIGGQSLGIFNGSNQTSVGNGAICSAANQITLGNSSVTALRCGATTIASLSDQRDKTDIVDSSYGLDFVSTLRPVQFKWDRRNLVAGDETSIMNGKSRVGFIAQELQAAMPNNENDILDLVYDVNPERIEAKYGNLIPILTKAIQDLSTANDALTARVAALESA